MSSQLAFAFFSLIVIVAAWRVVSSDNVMRAALALVIVLGGLAPIFIMLAAEFIATVQILVYVGAVVVLFLFGIMLTRSPMDEHVSLSNKLRWPGAVLAVGLFIILWMSIQDAVGREEVVSKNHDTYEVGQVLLRQHIIEFEAISVLLLAALIGSIVLARRESK